MAIPKLLICTDLDRTLIPNGAQPESPAARTTFSQLVALPEVTLAYVTGRHKELVEEAIAQYHLPLPNFVITDVGSTLYEITDHTWYLHEGWHHYISQDWQGKTSTEIQPFLADLKSLTLQEVEKQNLYKLSYYFTLDCDIQELIKAVKCRLEKNKILATVINSVDEAKEVGLLDVLPSSASKLQAIEFLMEQKAYTQSNTLFAGDSGNDLSVLVSPIKSVLVANAQAEVKAEASQTVTSLGNLDTLYIAQGTFLGMNGNYSAGILEGAAHYFPEVSKWLNHNK